MNSAPILAKTSIMKNILFIVTMGLFFNGLPAWAETLANAPQKIWSLPGFKNPESALYDAKRNVIYVSNVNGDPFKKDDNGFISKVSPDGKMLNLDWVTGLSAPKGLGLFGDKLFVADVDGLIEIDINSGKILKRHLVAGAKMPNDVAVGEDGIVYMSDMVDHAIYEFKDGKFSLLIKDQKLKSPNGLLVQGDKLYVASWGIMTAGFKTEVPGAVKTVNLKNLKISDVTKPLGNLDGIEAGLDGDFWVTDWLSGTLYHGKGSSYKVVLDLKSGSADLGSKKEGDTLWIFIPQMNEGVLDAYETKS